MERQMAREEEGEGRRWVWVRWLFFVVLKKRKTDLDTRRLPDSSGTRTNSHTHTHTNSHTHTHTHADAHTSSPCSAWQSPWKPNAQHRTQSGRDIYKFQRDGKNEDDKGRKKGEGGRGEIGRAHV